MVRKTIRYRVLFTPLVGQNTYGSEIDVSDKIDVSGVKNIRRSIDAGDYQVGVYTTDDITIKGHNINGFFNEDDTRSIFIAGRDQCKVKINFIEADDNGEETATVAFEGLINEEGTRINLKNDIIKFRVLSNDSAIRNTKVSSGAVNDGTKVSTAILQILNKPRITNVLTLSAGNINPDLDFTIDNGSDFDNKPTRDVLNQLLLASNSVLIIDSSNNIIVKSRDESTTTEVVNLFGKSDIFSRENIIDISKYNNGKHRMYTSVVVNGQEKSNAGFEEEFGTRQIEFTFNFITSAETAATIAARLLDEFKAPKIELNVKVATRDIKSTDLLHRVSVNYPLRAKPAGDFFPVYDVSKYGDTDTPYPFTFGSISVHPNTGFKIIEMEENPAEFTTILKLRQIGKELGDGTFSERGPALYDFAIYGEDVYSSGGSITFEGIYGVGKYDDTTTTYE